MVVKERSPKVIEDIDKRGLLKQYEKAKKFIELGHYQLVDLKLRKPKSLGIYSFRINDKFRCFCSKINGELVVHTISDHQKS